MILPARSVAASSFSRATRDVIDRRARRCELDETAFGVVGDCPERLIELVGQAAGHFADRGRPRDMTELFHKRLVPARWRFPARVSAAAPGLPVRRGFGEARPPGGG